MISLNVKKNGRGTKGRSKLCGGKLDEHPHGSCFTPCVVSAASVSPCHLLPSLEAKMGVRWWQQLPAVAKPVTCIPLKSAFVNLVGTASGQLWWCSFVAQWDMQSLEKSGKYWQFGSTDALKSGGVVVLGFLGGFLFLFEYSNVNWTKEE